jgi:plastocyanin
MRKAVVVLAGLGVLAFAQLAFGGADQATTWNVAVGEQAKPPAGTPKGASLNQFFPGRLTVNAGDSVTFTSVGFHTVTYAGGKPYPPFLGPAPGKTYQGITDSEGQPFFFDGELKFEYNPVAIGPYGPKAISRGKPASSGVIPGQSFKKPTKATSSFPIAGVFKLLCVVHPPDMAMTVVVKPKGASVPSTPDEVDAQAKDETEASWATAKVAVAKKPPANTVYMGVDGPKEPGGRMTVLDFVPDLTTVKVGATVDFVVRAPTEAHNVGFGPLKYLDKLMKQTELFPLPPGAPNQVTPFFIYGSDPPRTPYEGATMHGNGFYATPLADGVPGGLPNRSRITFTKPGKYHFLCLLHGPDMAADIRVTR